jgi:glycosyltransferase involved in cell wall biosynthesis
MVDLRARFALGRTLRRRTPVVVVAFGPTLRYCGLISVVSSVKLVYIAIGEPAYWLRSRLSALASRWLLRRTDQIIAVASATRDQLIEMVPELKGRVTVGHTGVPDLFFSIPRVEHDGPLRILMVGALSKEKDPAVAIDVLSALGIGKLRVVGSGPLHRRLSNLAQRLEVEHRVELVGGVDDVGPHFQWADVLLLTSKTEGLPAAVLEAGAAGVPTVAYCVGGVAEAVRDGITGILASPGEVDSLVAGLRLLDGDRALLSEMSQAARDHVRQNFRIDHAIDEYARLLVANSIRTR